MPFFGMPFLGWSRELTIPGDSIRDLFAMMSSRDLFLTGEYR